jgi:hypothetical protein
MKEEMDKRIEYLKTITIQQLLYLDTSLNSKIYGYTRLANKVTKQYNKIQKDIYYYKSIRDDL